MILKNLKIFFTKCLWEQDPCGQHLGNKKNFNIIFIQEPSWMFICTISSFYNKNSNSLVGAPNHPNWITFSRSSNNDNEHSHIILYINTCPFHMYFALRKNIFNHRDICYFSFFNNDDIFFIINVYSDDCQSTLKYLKNTEVNIQNMLIMAGNFNIRDSNWDPSYSFHSIYTDSLLEIVDLFDLNLSCSI